MQLARGAGIYTFIFFVFFFNVHAPLKLKSLFGMCRTIQLYIPRRPQVVHVAFTHPSQKRNQQGFNLVQFMFTQKDCVTSKNKSSKRGDKKRLCLGNTKIKTTYCVIAVYIFMGRMYNIYVLCWSCLTYKGQVLIYRSDNLTENIEQDINHCLFLL